MRNKKEQKKCFLFFKNMTANNYFIILADKKFKILEHLMNQNSENVQYSLIKTFYFTYFYNILNINYFALQKSV